MLGSPAQTIWTTQPRRCSSSGCNRSRVPAWMLHPTNVAEDRRHECLRLTTFLAGNGSQADFERHGQHFSSSEGKVWCHSVVVPGVFQGCIQNGLIRSLWASKPLICALGVKQRKALCFIPASQVLRHGVVHRILHRGRCLAGPTQVVVDVNPKAWNGQAGCFTSTLCEGRAFWAWGPLGGRHWAALSCWRACVGC